MTVIAKRYPLSAADGTPIPLDVLSPAGVLRVPFVASAGTSILTLPEGTDLLVCYSTENCFLSFSGSAAIVPTNNVFVSGLLHVPSSMVVNVAPPSLTISVIGEVTSGILTIQTLNTWAGTGLAVQYGRK